MASLPSPYTLLLHISINPFSFPSEGKGPTHNSAFNCLIIGYLPQRNQSGL